MKASLLYMVLKESQDGNTSSSRSSLIGVAISLGGNVLISLALNCQKLAHLRVQEQEEQEQEGQQEESQDDAHRFATQEGCADERSRLLKQEAPERAGSRYNTFSSHHRSIRSSGSLIEDGNGSNGSNGSDNDDEMQDGQAKAGNRNRSTDEMDNGKTRMATQGGEEEDEEGLHEDEREQDGEEEKPEPSTKFLRSRLWWVGMGLMVVGEFGNFLSYGFAPASLVAPLGAVALLSNVLISPVLLHEKFLPSDIGGIFLAIIGAVTVVFSSKQSDAQLGPEELWDAIRTSAFLAYSITATFVATFLVWCSTTRWGQRFILVDVGVCAIFGGFTVLSTKGLSSLLSRGNPFDLIRYPITYGLVAILAGTAVAQITFLNRALQRFDSREVIPTQFVLFTISAIVGSAVLYRDFADMDAHRLVNFLFGCLTTFAGVFTLTRDKYRGENEEGGPGRQTRNEQVRDDEAQVQVQDQQVIRPQDVQLLTAGRTTSDTAVLQVNPQQQKPSVKSAHHIGQSNDRGSSPKVTIAVPVFSPSTTPRGVTAFGATATSGTVSTSLTSTSSMPLRLAKRSLLGPSSTGVVTPVGVGAGLSAGHYLLLATTPPKPGTILSVSGGPSSATALSSLQQQDSSEGAALNSTSRSNEYRKRSMSQPPSTSKTKRSTKAERAAQSPSQAQQSKDVEAQRQGVAPGIQ